MEGGGREIIYYTGIYLEGLRNPSKTSISLVDDPTGRIHLQNVVVNQNYYHMNQLYRSQTYSVRVAGLRGIQIDAI
jgi:hypothetical protein